MSSNALGDNRDGLFQHVHGDVGLFFGHDERRGDADGAGAAAEEQDAAFEGEFQNAVALFGRSGSWSFYR